ncbi:MAG: hypothetical protein ACKVHQ_08425 [Gammaproteobacteria bacterium]|jgi:hypothetical protein
MKTKFISLIYKTVLLSILLTGISSGVYAGDEDMNPTAYSRFDPETGFMVAVDPNETTQQDHTPATDITSAPAEPVIASQPIEEPTQSFPLWTLVIAGVLGLGMIVLMIKKRKPNQESNLD